MVSSKKTVLEKSKVSKKRASIKSKKSIKSASKKSISKKSSKSSKSTKSSKTLVPIPIPRNEKGLRLDGIMDPDGNYANPLTGKPYTDEYFKWSSLWRNYPVYLEKHKFFDLIEKNQVILLISAILLYSLVSVVRENNK